MFSLTNFDSVLGSRRWLWWAGLVAVVVAEVLLALPAIGGDWLASGDDMEHILPELSAGRPADWLLGPWVGVRMFAYYRPVTSIVMWLQLEAFGTAESGWQALSLGLHACTTLMLAGLLVLLFQSRLAAVVGAGVWGLRSQLAEAIQWVPAQTDFLAGFFGVASLLGFAAWWTQPRRWKAVAGLLASVLAMGSKEVALVVPLVGVVLLFSGSAGPHFRTRRLVVGASLGTLAAFVAWRVWVLGGTGFLPGQAVGEGGLAGVRPEAVWRNLTRFLLPGPLGPFAYPSVSAAWVAGAVAILAGFLWRYGWVAAAAVATVGFVATTLLMGDPGYWLFTSTYLGLGLAILVFCVAWLVVRRLPREALTTGLVGLLLALPLYRVVYNKAGNVYYLPGIYWAMCWALSVKALSLGGDIHRSGWSEPTPESPDCPTPSAKTRV